ncbi:hypothetical protein L195_g044807 [Trifolium pratense]|uniref:Uncharacterized protein n=1 Tax=Trifolium pratense TaxID=57577 RepID=A0A2K3MD33_TRIPR|nr:hypothetical protein L195_g044807 [Trifolium pratense]
MPESVAMITATSLIDTLALTDYVPRWGGSRSLFSKALGMAIKAYDKPLTYLEVVKAVNFYLGCYWSQTTCDNLKNGGTNQLSLFCAEEMCNELFLVEAPFASRGGRGRRKALKDQVRKAQKRENKRKAVAITAENADLAI